MSSEPVSVIVTTYNSPATLRLVLLALGAQVRRPDEVVVADDGSGEETGAALAQLAGRLPFRLIRVWQPDEGFRAARSRNNAVCAAAGEALAFLDQDVLPHPEWLAAHLRRGGRGSVGIGHVLDLAAGRAAEADAAAAAGGLARLHAAAEYRALAALQRKYAFYALLRRMGLGFRARPKLRSCNASVHRADYAAVNGFDEEYVGWGQEDDDLGRRLYAAGARPVILVNRALVTHLPHAERRPRRWKDGANVARFMRRDLPARAARGLDAHPHPDVTVTRYG